MTRRQLIEHLVDGMSLRTIAHVAGLAPRSYHGIRRSGLRRVIVGDVTIIESRR